MAVVAAAATCCCMIGTPTQAFQVPSPPSLLAASRPRGTAAAASSRLRMSATGGSITPGGGDVLVIGGGLAGLSTALELAQRGAKVVVVNRDGGESASLAAGGMLAPQAERLAAGPYLDLCLQSRSMYAEWAADLEVRSGGISTGFAAAGGFLAPAFAGDAVDAWVPPPHAGPAYRLDATQMRAMEPELSGDVTGGWWYPDDMQVDARRLFRSLKESCLRAGVSVLEGPDWEVEALVFDPARPAINAVKMRDGRRLAYGKVVVANGAWMNRLLPVPLGPVKGQMLSLRPKTGAPSPLNRVIFAENCYLIPKADGRLIVGATVEPGQWDQTVTAGGVHELTKRALRICPALGECEVEETWAGLRPTTPDTLPVLGYTPWENLFVAGGYWRNGVLLAPRTGQLVADAVEGRLQGADQELLRHFEWSRFLPREGNVRRPAAAAVDAAMVAAAAAAASSISAPTPPVTSSLPIPPPAPVSRPTTSSSSSGGAHSDDPYADYAKLKASANTVDTEAIIREARRVNREGLVAYGLGEDAVGKEVASKFNVPSAGMGNEWSTFDQAAQQGVQDLGMFDVNYLKDDSHLTHKPMAAARHVTTAVLNEEEEDESIESLMARLGYEYEDPREAKVQDREARREMARRGITPPPPSAAEVAKKAKAAEGDAYEDYYSTEVREKVGWEVLKQRQEQAQAGASGAAQQQHNDDPYADYAKLKAAANTVDTEAIIREARRVNREGLVGYGLGEDAMGKEVASKFNVPSAGLSEEWSAFDQAARQGVQDMGHYDETTSSAVASSLAWVASVGPSGHAEEEEGQGIEDLMASLGYEYEDPRATKNRAFEARRHAVPSTSPSPSPTATTAPSMPTASRPPPPPPPPPPAAAQRPSSSSSSTPGPLPSPPDRPPPPWAGEVQALYERVKSNQAAARRRQGLPASDSEVVVPFKTRPEDMPKDAQGRPRQLTMQEVLEKLEVMRVNPDGSFTKVERGQGLPPPWVPAPQPSAVGFETLPRPSQSAAPK